MTKTDILANNRVLLAQVMATYGIRLARHTRTVEYTTSRGHVLSVTSFLTVHSDPDARSQINTFIAKEMNKLGAKTWTSHSGLGAKRCPERDVKPLKGDDVAALIYHTIKSGTVSYNV